jgi:hypothetical protein
LEVVIPLFLRYFSWVSLIYSVALIIACWLLDFIQWPRARCCVGHFTASALSPSTILKNKICPYTEFCSRSQSYYIRS